MKHTRIILFFGVLVLALVAGSVCFAAQAEWKVVVPQKVFAQKLRAAAFLNENFGVNGGAGDIGKARYTLDGGETWTQVESSGG